MDYQNQSVWMKPCLFKKHPAETMCYMASPIFISITHRKAGKCRKWLPVIEQFAGYHDFPDRKAKLPGWYLLYLYYTQLTCFCSILLFWVNDASPCPSQRCLSPNPQYVWRWYERVLVSADDEDEVIRVGSNLIWLNLCKKGKFGHRERHVQREDHAKT